MFHQNQNMNKELTKAEEQVMEHLWELEEAFVKEIVERMEEPRPAYTTISTIIRILEKKEIVAHKTYGNTHKYFPLISKAEYSEYCTRNLIRRHFEGSLGNLVSFFTSKNNLSLGELEEIQQLINDEINQKKQS